MDLNSFLYSASSFHAIARPVTIAMVLAALASVYINDADTLASGAQELAEAYTVFKLNNDNDTGGSPWTNLLKSVGNTFVICATIAIMTFVIVILYKYKCMKLLTGYMIFSSASLLGLLGGSMVQVAAYIYYIPIDTLSFLLILYNFAAVGILAIFYSQGIPDYITQGYLVATAVILAWNLAHFDDWTAWTLLVMLALYDLWAVLSPYGPLKALVNLMQQKDSPDMPGLLYEAKLENHHTRQKNHTNSANSGSTDTTPTTTTTTISNTTETIIQPHSNYTSTTTVQDKSVTVVQLPLAIARLYQLTPCADSYHRYPRVAPSYTIGSSSTTLDHWDSIQAEEPLLRHAHSPPISTNNSTTINTTKSNTSLTPSLKSSSFYKQKFTKQELVSEISVLLPTSRGRIDQTWNQQHTQAKYWVYNGEGILKRILMVNRRGQIYQINPEKRNNNSDNDEEEGNDDDDDEMEDEYISSSIRLGLGDFIFYSVLVAKAAMYSFTTFAACILVILTGLGATLLLLSLYQSALPALPFSIFLGVFFYLMTRSLIQPWIHNLMTLSFYV